MTPQRDNRSDWAEFSERRKADERLARKALALGTDALTPAERARLEEPDTPRAKPQQHESAAMQTLAVMVARAWWAPGWWRWEHATMHKREAWRNAREGVRPGWPDCGLFIPDTAMDERPDALKHDGFTHFERAAIRALCELKAEHRKPMRGGKGGVSDAQRQALDDLARCGFECYVAYGAEDAYQWLDKQAGPRPEVLPW